MQRIGPVMIFVVFVSLLASGALAAEFQVVVHPSVEGSRISRAVLAEIYQKEVILWGDQSRIHPIDQSSQAPVRLAFTQEILGWSLGEVQDYWTNRLATERQMPPPTRANDDEVLAFVASKKGAIGYVSAGIDIPAGVKTLTLVD